MFKYGYRKSYVIVNLIIAVVLVTGIFNSSKIEMDVYIVGEAILRDKTLLLKSAGAIFIYLVSMMVSNKIYMKKEIAN
ncbi:MAG: hypothetical protein RSC26_04670 [Terrisporobacter sp.]